MDIIVAADKILWQIDSMLDQLKLADYSRSSHLLNSSTIGQHVRHTLEFFLCLKDGLKLGCVNYDNRKRDKMIEEDLEFARNILVEISNFLRSDPQNIPLELEANFSHDLKSSVVIPTNFNRELVYNIEHATHHMALIRVAVSEFGSYSPLPQDFGVATSTIRNNALIR